MPTRKQYPLRIDPSIWNAIELWARDEMRSSNGQIEWMLKESLARAHRLPSPHAQKNADGSSARAQNGS